MIDKPGQISKGSVQRGVPRPNAGVAQQVEQGLCKAQVGGSNPAHWLQSPTAFEEPPGSCTWQPFKSGSIEGIRRVELKPIQTIKG
jgi:hypothetical protein